MGDFYEQCVCVKFCFKLEKMFLETFKMLIQVFGDEAMSKTQTHERYKCFQEGRTSVDDNECSGNLQHRNTKKTSKKFRKGFIPIVV
jgi:hypothetical protein